MLSLVALTRAGQTKSVLAPQQHPLLGTSEQNAGTWLRLLSLNSNLSMHRAFSRPGPKGEHFRPVTLATQLPASLP